MTKIKYNPDIHHRRSIRLRDYDYAQAGAYFVTICARNRECVFGEIVDGRMRLNEWGEIIEYTWDDLPNHNQGILLDEFVIMPNHIHGIIVIVDDVRDTAYLVPTGNTGNNRFTVGADSKSARIDLTRAGLEPAPTSQLEKKRHGLSEIIRQLKTFSTRRINEIRQNPSAPLWQRNYYEHVIRSEEDLARIREYIAGNPLKWGEDEYNPAAKAGQ